MEFKARTNHHALHLLLRLLFLLILTYIPFASKAQGPSDLLKGDIIDIRYPSPAPAPAPNEGGHSVKQNNAQYCGVPEPHCQPCPLTLQPDAFKELKNNLGPVIRQRLMELLEKTRIAESTFEVVHTINMLKLLNESNSEFENLHNGAQRLRDAYLKLGNKPQPM